MQKRQILVVDNNPVIIKLMTNFLEKEGHEVRTAENGLSALDVLEGFHPEVIFVDLIMPKIGGEKLCRIIRSMPEMDNIYLAILSAVAVEHDIDFNEFGADFCIAKGPFKQVGHHITDLLKKTTTPRTGYLSNTIVGTENVYRRQVTSELLLTKQHFEITLDNIAEGFIEITPGLRIIYINPVAAEILGKSEEAALSSHLIDFIDNSQKKEVAEILKNMPDVPLRIGEESPLFLNGNQVLLTLLSFDDQEQKSTIVIVQNITARKKIESELKIYKEHLEELVTERTTELVESFKKIKEETHHRKLIEAKKNKLEALLRQKQKMEALGTMAGGVAHDFKNILTGIIGFAELLQLDFKKEGQSKHYLDSLLSAANRAKELTERILTFSRKDEKEFSKVQFQPIITEVLKLLTASTPESITVKENIDPECGYILGDSTQLHQVLMNLCTNSIQAMKKSGGILEVNLASHDTTEQDRAAHLNMPAGRCIRLSVKDTGHGMDKKTEERIFDPYFTTKEVEMGTGLGLAVTAGIVENHGGMITVDSQLGAGASFEVFMPEVNLNDTESDIKPETFAETWNKEYLPDTDSSVETASDIQEQVEFHNPDHPILVVDDNPVIHELFRAILKNWNTRYAFSVKEALEILAKESITVVISDVVMPEATGINLLKEIKRRYDNRVQVIMMTSSEEVDNLYQAFESGAHDFILKPFSRIEIENVLESTFSRIYRWQKSIKTLRGKSQV